ncbi:unnamed protein product [Closterium sp. NIES-65]|nr:unnamed protein product [Closterium sp. NIES-65]
MPQRLLTFHYPAYALVPCPQSHVGATTHACPAPAPFIPPSPLILLPLLLVPPSLNRVSPTIIPCPMSHPRICMVVPVTCEWGHPSFPFCVLTVTLLTEQSPFTTPTSLYAPTPVNPAISFPSPRPLPSLTHRCGHRVAHVLRQHPLSTRFPNPNFPSSPAPHCLGIIPTIIPYPMAHSTAGAAARPCPVPACAAACGLLEGERGEGEGGTTYNQLALHDAIDLLLLAHSPHTPRWGGGGDLEKRGWEKGGRTTSSYDQLTQHHAVCWHVVLIHGMWLGEETGGKSTGEREQRHHTPRPPASPAPQGRRLQSCSGTTRSHSPCPSATAAPPPPPPPFPTPLLAISQPSPWPHISPSPRPRLPVPQPHLEEGIGDLFAGEPALILYSHLPPPLRLARV